MLSAFTPRPIVELRPRDKFRIESVLANGDRLLVGLSTGALRIYRINEVGAAFTLSQRSVPTRSKFRNGNSGLAAAGDGSGDEQKEEGEEEEDDDNHQPKEKVAELLSEKEKFSTSKIEQLAIIKEANLLVSLSSGFVSIHDLHNFELQERLSKTKGATAFAVTSNIVKDPSTGVPAIVSRLAVAVKRRLMLWSWHDTELEAGTPEIALVSGIKTLTWASERKIMAGLGSSYVLVDVDHQSAVPIVGPGGIGGNAAQESGRLGGMGVETMNYIGMGAMVPKPLATRLGEGEMLLAKDINTHFINRDGEPLGRRQIPWRAAPEAIGYSYPYLLSLQETAKGTLEVRNPHTLSLLQSIALPGASLLHVARPNISIAHAGKGFLVASDRFIWRMIALGYDSQIDALVERGHLDEAISLLDMLEDALLRDKEGRLREVKMRKAQTLFDAKTFQDSLDLFTEVAAPPERVIRLYPKVIAGDLAEEEPATDGDILRPESHASPTTPTRKMAFRGHGKRNSITSSARTPTGPADDVTTPSKGEQHANIDTASEQTPTKGAHSDKDLKTAARALQGFLADVRRRLKPFFNEDQSLKDESEVRFFDQNASSETVLERLLGIASLRDVDRGHRLREVAILVDTTLFRTHMYATPYLVGALFRIPNFCDPDVVMEKLEETERYNDLVDFLYGKRLHRQALERLQKFGQATGGDNKVTKLRGPARTIRYLQSLSPDHIDLILEFAEWPLKSEPELGMHIFIADTENAETLPREQVVEFLERTGPPLAQRYLEHVIDELDDQTPRLHQRLLTLYLDRIKQHISVEDSAADDQDHNHDDELHTRFLSLLKTSRQYSPARVLGMLPRDDSTHPTFHYARAIVFSKMGQHKQALEIYVFKLHDPAKAEEYCNQVHLKENAAATAAAAAAATTTTTIVPASRIRPSPSSSDPEREEKPGIYHILLGLYLNPPSQPSTTQSQSQTKPPNKPSQPAKDLWTSAALNLLTIHGSRLPASSTLALIPASLPVRDLEFYFRSRIGAANTVVADAMVVAGLRKVEAVRVQELLLVGDGAGAGAGGSGRGRRVRVDDERVCGVCFKRLGGSVISVFPDNSVVHLGCSARKQQQ